MKNSVGTQCETEHFDVSENQNLYTETDSLKETVSFKKSAKKQSQIEANSMKFAKPKTLIVNEYPDILQTMPQLFKEIVSNVIRPPENSPLSKFHDMSVTYLKDQKRDRAKKAQQKLVGVNFTELGRTLYFIVCSCRGLSKEVPFRALVDTGAANSLLHISVVNKLGLKYRPLKLTLATATGLDDTAIKGVLHLQFALRTGANKIIRACTNFIVTTRLNGLQSIIGAEFLMDNDNVYGITRTALLLGSKESPYYVEIFSDGRAEAINDPHCNGDIFSKQFVDMTCQHCGNLNGKKMPEMIFPDTIVVKHTHWQNIRDELKNSDPENTDYTYENECIWDNNCKIIPGPLSNDQIRKFSCQSDSELPEGLIDLETLTCFSHTIKEVFVDEKLPPSEELFDETVELKFEILDKTISLDEADYSDCPPKYYPKLRSLLDDFHDRFSKRKLDIEITDLYTAPLDTFKGKKVIQHVRKLPNHKYEFAYKALKQLEQAGVISESDSPWRSNVVMIPKPMGKNELRANTKADYQSGDHNAAMHYRICLDFRDLNDILIFPQQVAFPTLDKFLYRLRNKIVVSVDISSSFYVIPIEEKDRYKTAFWLNDQTFEFNVLVMGLKSSPYHLKKFIEKVFDQENYDEFSVQLSSEERALIPRTFREIIDNYFDDVHIFADNEEQLLAVTKLCLLVARKAKIKFSVEKSSFLTTKIKIL
ncbi:MAG: reverse transcriptase domain-containing protein, partial [Anaerovoracaceae bacterium]